MSDKTKQLLANPNEQEHFNPKTNMGSVIDDNTGEDLYSYLSRFNHLNVGYVASAVSARGAVPAIMRKNGLIITYYINEKPITEQYVGDKNTAGTDAWTDNNNWQFIDGIGQVDTNSITLNQLSKEVLDLIGKNKKINIVNYPDGEDLTQFDICGGNSKNKVNVLKFADKEYNPANFSGLGKVYLRKNIVEVKQEDGSVIHKNILTQDMINKENTEYIIQYNYDLNKGNITIPENCVLNFQQGNIINGVVYSNKTKIINIPNNFNIMGNIYDISNNEITIKGEILNHKIKVLAPTCVYTPSWWKSDYGEDRFMKIARDLGITDFSSLVRIDNTTLPNYQCQPYNEFADAETFATRFLTNGYKEIFAIKFHTEGDFNDSEEPELIMPNFINYITSYVTTVLNKGLKIYNVYIVNEQSNWTNKGSEYIDYIIELANNIRGLGLTPRISFDSIYSLKNADSRLYDIIEPDFNFYPTISFLDSKTKYNKDISNELIESYKNIYNIAWNKPLSSFGISESGICPYEKAFRYPWEYRKKNLGNSMNDAPVIYWNILSDFVNTLNNPFICVWFFEGLTKKDNIDIDMLYNIFVHKIK